MSAALTAEPLAEVTRTVLEEASFLFCDALAPDAEPWRGRIAEATLSFEGPCDGALTLRLPWALAREAAANLLGCEPDDPELDASALAAAGELLNMISGSALAAWFGAGARWTLGVPSTRALEGELPSTTGGDARVAFAVDAAPLEIEAVERGRSG
ncbi:MAG: chemotaxis protein CheX [Myxococcota bacterium]